MDFSVHRHGQVIDHLGGIQGKRPVPPRGDRSFQRLAAGELDLPLSGLRAIGVIAAKSLQLLMQAPEGVEPPAAATVSGLDGGEDLALERSGP